ncbi:MAG: hypothetical protein ABIQ18_10145 [Umezawaea sp.]
MQADRAVQQQVVVEQVAPVEQQQQQETRVEPEQATSAPAVNASVVFAGATLVVGPPEGASQQALTLARSLPADRGRTVVVIDFPPGGESTFWQAAANALRGRGGIRLAVSFAGSMRPTAPAQWLASQLNAEVIAPDGALTTVPGAAFVTGSTGYGSWLRFLPGASPTPFGRRFPVPAWEAMDPNSAWPTGDVGIAEPIPAGLWLRAQSVPFDPNSQDARAIVALPCRENVLTIVIGGPGQPSIPTEEICKLLNALPSAARSRVRLVQYDIDAGAEQAQQVAEQLGEPINVYTGLPVSNLREGGGAVVVAVDRRGKPTWHPFVTEMRCIPRAQAEENEVSGYRNPVPGLGELTPGVFGLGDGVVLEVVASGLWVREAAAAGGADVRALPVDPEWARLTVGTPGRSTPGAVAVAGAALVERLEPEVRKLLRLVFCDTTETAIPWPTAVEEESTKPTPVFSEPEEPARSAPAHALVAEPATVVTAKLTPAPEPATVNNHPVVQQPVEVPTQVTATAVEEPSVTHDDLADSEIPLRIEGPVPTPPSPAWEPKNSKWGEELHNERETIPADHQTTDLERDAVRRILGDRYPAYATAVGRLLAQRSGPIVDTVPVETLVTELAALSAYVGQDEEMIVETLRKGSLGRLRPYVAAVVAGLRRLPLHQGITTCWSLAPSNAGNLYRTGEVLVEHGLLNTHANPQESFDGGVEYLVWSLTGRRVEVVDRRAGVVNERVLFAPATAFKVLAVAESDGSAPTQVLLQEVADSRTERQLAQMRPGVLTQLERAAVALRSLSNA